MEGINFVTDENGNRITLQIDLSYTKRRGKDYILFMENLEDVIDIELSKKEVAEPWEEFKSKLDQEEE